MVLLEKIRHPEGLYNGKEQQEDKMIPEEALQIAEKRRDVRGKGEKERSIHLNAEFPGVARRGKKGFLDDQCK